MAAFVARFERPTEPVRVFLSERRMTLAQLGSVSQLLRLNAAGTLAADLADIEMSRRPDGWESDYSRPITRFWVVQSNGRSTCGVSFRSASSPRSAIASTIFGARNASRMRRAT